jgi:adenylate kinase
MNFIIFGSQASGKGTQANKIAAKYGIPHISTGDIFRESVNEGTELGKKAEKIMKKGILMPDDLTNEIVKERLKKDDCEEGFILDGYPRTKDQAEYLDKLNYKINAVINLEISEEELIKRISSRRVCADCKANYNLLTCPPKKKGLCDKCNGKLVQRDDDKLEAIKKRLLLYHELTEPLLKFYEEKGVVIKINGEQKISKVFDSILKELSAL